MKFDDVFGNTNQFGRCQIILYSLLAFGAIPTTLHNLSIVIIAAVPGHVCAVPEVERLNISDTQRLNLTIPKKIVNGKEQYDECLMYDRSYENITESNLDSFWTENNQTVGVVECRSGWSYDKSQYTNTITSQWNLVCGRKAWVTTAKTVYLAGKMVGGIVIGFVGDRFGRRKATLVSFVAMWVMSLAEAFAPEIISFIVFRFVVAVFSMEFFNAIFIMALEFVSPSHRVYASFGMLLSWDIGYVILALIALGIRDWFWLQIIITAIFTLCVTYFCFLPESPRWLFSVGRGEEAMEVLRKMTPKEHIHELPEKFEIEKEDKNGTPLDLFRTPNIRKRTFVLFFLWIVCAMVYYGITLNTHRLGGESDHLNLLLVALSSLPNSIIAAVVCKKFGGKWPQIIFIVGSGVVLLVSTGIPEDMVAFRIALGMIGRLLVAAAFNVAYVYSSELYPTVIRNMGLSACSMMARVGGTMAPIIGDLGDFTGFTPLPFIIFGIFSILAGLASLTLPNSNKGNLPETIQDAEAMGKASPKVLQSNGNAKVDAERSPSQEAVHMLGETNNSEARRSTTPENDSTETSEMLETGSENEHI